MTDDNEKSTPKFKQAYDKKRQRIAVSFNLENEAEAAMYEYAQTLKFSVWAKDKLTQEMEMKK